MAAEAFDRRVFTLADQEAFAHLSGDSNPMHMDAAAARRTQAGHSVAHGMHVLSWALDAAARHGVLRHVPASMRVQFPKFTYIDRPVSLTLTARDDEFLRLELSQDELVTAVFTLTLSQARATPAPLPTAPIIARSDTPREYLDFQEIAGVSGSLALNASARAQRFPSAAALLGVSRLDAIAQLSRLVGMVCPGLHSVFASMTLDFVETAVQDALTFHVTVADPRFRVVRMEVQGGGVAGTVQAFVRVPPVRQPRLQDLRGAVRDGEFAGATTLIVGGSRGLGALTARLLAAGGARLVVTYASGRSEAEELAAEINAAAPGSCRVLPFDMRGDIPVQTASLPAEITHLYYFATPQIFRQKGAVFVPGVLEDFLHFYVYGFHQLHSHLSRVSALTAGFYPSTVAVEEHPLSLTEYSMAKRAGEMMCADLMRADPARRIVVHRLPRLETDQTATLMHVKSENALAVMLPIVREVQAAGVKATP